MWCLCKVSLLVEIVEVVEVTCQQVVVVVNVLADAVGIADIGQVVAGDGAIDGAVAVVGGQVVVAAEVVAEVAIGVDVDGGQGIAVDGDCWEVEVWEIVDHVVDCVADDVVELWVARLVVVLCPGVDAVDGDADWESLVGVVGAGHGTAGVPMMVIEDVVMVEVVDVFLGIGPCAADVVATEPVDVQDQVEEVEEAADVQGQVEEVEEVVQLAVVMQVLVDREWLVHQPTFVGQAVSFVRYAARLPAIVAEEVLLQLC